MTDHVPDIERCKKLKEKGFPQEGVFTWVKGYGYHYVAPRKRIFPTDRICAAPIVTELMGEIIKIAPTGGDTLNFVDMMLTKRGDFYVGCLDGPMVHADTLPNALADLWIWLREREP